MNDFSINAESINASEDSFIQRVITGLIARVNIAANATVYRKNTFSSEAFSVTSSLLGRVIQRSVLNSYAEYYAINNGKVYPRNFVTSLVTLTAAVFIEIKSGLKKRTIIFNTVSALFDYAATVHKRSITIQVAEAYAVPEVSVFREIPWDEPAPADRTFIVPKGEHVFYVRT